MTVILLLPVTVTLIFSADAVDEKDRLHWCCEALKEHLVSLNEAIKNNEVADHIESAIKNVQHGVRYEHLDGHGPKHPRVTRKCPLAKK